MKGTGKKPPEPFWVLPDREWAKLVGPRKSDVAVSSIEVKGDRLIVPIPKSLAEGFTVKRGSRIRARYSRGVLVVEPVVPKRRRRGA